MLKLSSTCVSPLSQVTEPEVTVRRVTVNPNFVRPLRSNEFLLFRKAPENIPPGFAGYLFFEKPSGAVPRNSFLLEQELSYLDEGDIVRLNQKRNSLRTLYRRNSPHNFFLTTERCNNFCLMCSQPPKDNEDSYLADEILTMIPLVSPETKAIGLTGGEPTLLGQKLIDIVRHFKSYLPSTALHILSNGRQFKDLNYAKSLAAVAHPDLMIGTPVYSDISSIHDYVVQADGAFDDTIRGIINLKSAGVRVEIRVVIHKATYERLPDLALFIRRNLTFCDHVALMGLEITGFTKINLNDLWIDPKDYQPQLREAVELLHRARMAVSVYNHQLCVLDPALTQFSRKSISDWKNEYMPECEGCTRRSQCGGFFSSAKLRYSAHIAPFRD
ncbi:MAG: His-Xaa-Ser system radical SAM maturase HxsC [Verrucomicrobiota bacterium]|jgi:His-Xaa-Ser system radical SAM maturase HxsC